MGSTFCVMTRLSSAFMEHTRWLPPGLHPSREQRRRGRPGWGVGRGSQLSRPCPPGVVGSVCWPAGAPVSQRLLCRRDGRPPH